MVERGDIAHGTQRAGQRNTVAHPIERRGAEGAVLGQQTQHRFRQGPQRIVATRQVAQLVAQAKQRAAQALIVARDPLLQTVMRDAKDVMGPGELVEPQLAVVVGQVEPFQAPLPDITKLPYQHAANEHTNDEGRRHLRIQPVAVAVIGDKREDQQHRANHAPHEAVAHAEQQGRHQRPVKRSLHHQRVFG